MTADKMRLQKSGHVPQPGQEKGKGAEAGKEKMPELLARDEEGELILTRTEECLVLIGILALVTALAMGVVGILGRVLEKTQLQEKIYEAIGGVLDYFIK